MAVIRGEKNGGYGYGNNLGVRYAARINEATHVVIANQVDTYDERVYQKARELLDQRIEDGTFVTEDRACYYLYQLTMDGRSPMMGPVLRLTTM